MGWSPLHPEATFFIPEASPVFLSTAPTAFLSGLVLWPLGVTLTARVST